ncbi:MAG: hypothetical protein R2788_11130 [Saprospiraceae bacterium]
MIVIEDGFCLFSYHTENVNNYFIFQKTQRASNQLTLILTFLFYPRSYFFFALAKISAMVTSCVPPLCYVLWKKNIVAVVNAEYINIDANIICSTKSCPIKKRQRSIYHQ